MTLCSAPESGKTKADLTQYNSPSIRIGYRKVIRRKSHLHSWPVRSHWAPSSAVCRHVLLKTWAPGCFTESNCWILEQLGAQTPQRLHVALQAFNSRSRNQGNYFSLFTCVHHLFPGPSDFLGWALRLPSHPCIGRLVQALWQGCRPTFLWFRPPVGVRVAELLRCSQPPPPLFYCIQSSHKCTSIPSEKLKSRIP